MQINSVQRAIIGRLTRQGKSQRAGFTLIEIIVVIIIVGILAAIAAPNLTGYLQRQRLNLAQDRILQGMRRAQSEARRRQLDYQFSLRTATEDGEGVIQIATHPVELSPGADMENCFPTSATFTDLTGSNAGLAFETIASTDDVEVATTTTLIGGADCSVTGTGAALRVRFSSDGTLASDLGTVTLQLARDTTTQRCVVVSTLLGALRTDADDGC